VVTEAFPAERAFEVKAREAADAQAANIADTASAVPRIFARSFISVTFSKEWGRYCGTRHRRQVSRPQLVRRYGVFGVSR
jgi:hypothetical protein